LSGEPSIGAFVAKKFKAPSIESLASVDGAACKYSSDIIEIVGVVSLSGQGGWPKCDEYEVHCFEFAAWRRVGNPLVEQTLTVLRPVQDVGKAFNDFKEGTIHRVRVLVSVDQTRAVFVERINSPGDVELKAIVDRLKQPVVVETVRFGRLTLDRRINWFEGEANWNGQVVSLCIEPDDNLDVTNQLRTADSLFSESAKWGEKVRQFAVKDKLELASDWQGGEVTEKDFLARMTLKAISIKPEGQFEFWHDDGDLFWGHSIQICGSLKEGLTRSDIPG
jgi:hypothetical protein